MKRRFTKSMRIRSSRDFEAVYVSNVHAADNVLVINGARNGQSDTRLGMSIGRQVGSAVVRNRWKRLIREAFRANATQLPSGLDLVVKPRRGAEPNLDRIAQSLEQLSKQIEQKLKRRNANERASDSNRGEQLPPKQRSPRSEQRK